MTITLTHPDLGSLNLRAKPFTVASFQIGSRGVRSVTRNRALANGTFDDTKYTGARAATLAVVLNEDAACDGVTMQALYDQMMPYTRPDRRPVLSWSLPGSEQDRRQMTVRGDSAPIVVDRDRHPAIVCSFVSPDGEITSAVNPICVLFDPASDVELGRTYDLVFDRVYPASLGVGDRLITQNGNDDAQWVLTIFGPVTNPTFRINGTTVAFTSNGGLDIVAGSSVVIDSRERTVYLNGDPANPRYDRTNFTQWSWPDLVLKPGDNLAKFSGSVVGVGGSALLCYRPTWMS